MGLEANQTPDELDLVAPDSIFYGQYYNTLVELLTLTIAYDLPLPQLQLSLSLKTDHRPSHLL